MDNVSHNNISIKARARAAKRRGVSVVAAAVAAVAIGACSAPPPPMNQVQNPAPDQLVDQNYGANKVPSRVDVPYVANAHMGCGPGAVTHDVCFGSQTMDVFPRVDNGVAPRGTIVYVHGGGFAGGDKKDRGFAGPLWLQGDRGWDIVTLNYRLTRNGFVDWATQLADVSAAVDWLRANGSSIGVDTTRVVLYGWSAGGTLSALVGTGWNSGLPFYKTTRVDGWVDQAGINDFGVGGQSTSIGLEWTGAAVLNSGMSSAVNLVDHDDPPGYIIHGDDDGIVTVANAYRLKDAADARVANVKLDVVDGYRDLTWLPLNFRNHAPAGGINVPSLNSFFDSL